MTRISKEEVKKVAQLARLELNEFEINNHAEQLAKILDYIKQLDKINFGKIFTINFTNIFELISSKE